MINFILFLVFFAFFIVFAKFRNLFFFLHFHLSPFSLTSSPRSASRAHLTNWMSVWLPTPQPLLLQHPYPLPSTQPLFFSGPKSNEPRQRRRCRLCVMRVIKHISVWPLSASVSFIVKTFILSREREEEREGETSVSRAGGEERRGRQAGSRPYNIYFAGDYRGKYAVIVSEIK